MSTRSWTFLVLTEKLSNISRLYFFRLANSFLAGLCFDMTGLYTVLLLFCSNVFMTLAWYGHLRLQQTGVTSHWPLIGVIAFSWGIAFFEYCCQVPANRIGFSGNGGPFSLVQLKVIQECISLIVFALVANILFQGQHLQWNHALAFVFLVAAVYLVFMKP